MRTFLNQSDEMLRHISSENDEVPGSSPGMRTFLNQSDEMLRHISSENDEVPGSSPGMRTENT